MELKVNLCVEAFALQLPNSISRNTSAAQLANNTINKHNGQQLTLARLLYTSTLSGKSQLSEHHFRGNSGHHNGIWHCWSKEGFNWRHCSMNRMQQLHTHQNPCMKNQWRTTLRQLNVIEGFVISNWRCHGTTDARKLEKSVIFCGEKPWELCEQRASSLLYLVIRTERRPIFRSKDLHFSQEKNQWKSFGV